MGQMNELGGDQTSQSMSMLEFTARRFGGFAFAHPTQYDPIHRGRAARRAVMAAAKPPCAGCATADARRPTRSLCLERVFVFVFV